MEENRIPNTADEAVTKLEAETVRLAKEYFRQGLNCAECVLLAFLEASESKLPREAVVLASGFGGGVGRTKHLCGAVSGAVMALGTVKGRADPLAIAEPRERAKHLSQAVYPHFAALIGDVEAQFGSSTCAELTSKFADFDGKERRVSCASMVEYCAGLAARAAAGEG